MADINDLFGSDSEEDDQQRDKVIEQDDGDESGGATHGRTPAGDDWEEENGEAKDVDARHRAASEEEEDVRQTQPQRRKGPPMLFEAPEVPRPDSGSARLVQLSNIINIETQPFDPATFKEVEEEVYVDELGHQRVRLPDQNVIRWRRKLNEDGTTIVESNARFVRWSDGSLQLLIGDEVLDVAEVDIEKDNNYLFLRHVQAQVLEGMGKIGKKLAFRPGSLNSRFHRRLREAVEKRNVKTNRVRRVATVADPVREKQEREKQEEARIRAAEQLERRQNKVMRTYRAPNVYDSRSHRAEAGLSAQYLEAMDDDRGFGADSDEEEDAEDTGLGYSGPADLRRSNFGDEEEAERRLAQAKRPQAIPSAQRRDLDSDEEVEGAGGAQEADGEDEEDDDILARKQAPRKRQRGLVLSDDDD